MLRTVVARDLNNLGNVLADQGAREGREDRDPAASRLGFVGADDLVSVFLPALVLEEHRGAEGDAVAADRGLDHLGVADLGLERRDPALDEAQLFPRGVVLGVFRQIPVRARLGNRLGGRRPLDALETLELLLELLVARAGHRRSLDRHGLYLSTRPGWTPQPRRDDGV